MRCSLLLLVGKLSRNALVACSRHRLLRFIRSKHDRAAVVHNELVSSVLQLSVSSYVKLLSGDVDIGLLAGQHISSTCQTLIASLQILRKGIGVIVQLLLCAHWFLCLLDAAHGYLLGLSILIDDHNAAVLVGNVSVLQIHCSAVIQRQSGNVPLCIADVCKFLLTLVVILHRLTRNTVIDTVLNSSYFNKTVCRLPLFIAQLTFILIKQLAHSIFVVILNGINHAVAESVHIPVTKSLVEPLVGKVYVMLYLHQLGLITIYPHATLVTRIASFLQFVQYILVMVLLPCRFSRLLLRCVRHFGCARFSRLLLCSRFLARLLHFCTLTFLYTTHVVIQPLLVVLNGCVLTRRTPNITTDMNSLLAVLFSELLGLLLCMSFSCYIQTI